jgi:hypothetical protein
MIEIGNTPNIMYSLELHTANNIDKSILIILNLDIAKCRYLRITYHTVLGTIFLA